MMGEEGLREEKMGIDSESDEKKPLLRPPEPRKGGLRTMPFIIVNESFERIASFGLLPNMIFYLMSGYHFDAVTGSTVLSIWSAVSNFLAIFGAFLSDSYLGRFRVITIGSISSLLGTTLLWLTAMIPQLRPMPCDHSKESCDSPTAAHLALLVSSFGLISIGAGCVRPCSIAFGADQLQNKESNNNKRALESYFNWYYASISISTIISLTIIVYIQDHLGWQVGFGVPVILMVISAALYLLGSSLYIKVQASQSLFTGFIRVLVAAYRNRNVKLPPSSCNSFFHGDHESKFFVPTGSLRCLNKACVIRDPGIDLKPDGSASNPWSLCTVEQVESLKALLSIIPLWSSGIMLLVCITQTTFSTLQAKTMDRHITSGFEIPPGSFIIFMVMTLTIWIAAYDRIMMPLLAKCTGHPSGLSPKIRMGIGLVLACIAMAVSAITESVRRGLATEERFEDNPAAVVNMSALWLVPQFALLGLAEAFNSIGQIEFFYTKFPKSMSSIAMAVYTLGLAVSSLLGGLLVNIVDGITTTGGKISWLSSDINAGHVDYYYGVLAFLNLVNFLYFLICCRANGSCEDKGTRLLDEVEEESSKRLPPASA